jgi:hypothetical protein
MFEHTPSPKLKENTSKLLNYKLSVFERNGAQTQVFTFPFPSQLFHYVVALPLSLCLSLCYASNSLALAILCRLIIQQLRS